MKSELSSRTPYQKARIQERKREREKQKHSGGGTAILRRRMARISVLHSPSMDDSVGLKLSCLTTCAYRPANVRDTR